MPSENGIASELDLSEPSDELLEWAKDNIDEDPEKTCQIIEEFRDMIYERGECTPHRMDDEFLLRFLRARHFILRRAHRLLVNYCDFKEENPEFYQDVDLEDLSNMGDENIITVPPYRENTGRRMIIYRAGQWDPVKYSVEELFQATIACMEVAVVEPQTQIKGGIGIFDFSGLTMQQAWYLTPSIAHKVLQIMVTSFPMKIHALHIVNQSFVFDVMYNIFKPLLNSTMKERIFFHGDKMESLHKHVDPKHLPERYGGIHPDYNYKDWIEYFRKNDQIINELKSLGYREYTNEEREHKKKMKESTS